MILHEHPGFQSDIVLILETVDASLIIGKALNCPLHGDNYW